MKRNIGFYLNTVSLLAIVAGVVLYQFVSNKMGVVTGLLAIAALIVAASNFLPPIGEMQKDESPVLILGVVFSAVGLVTSFYSQINQIGYVIAGLDPISILTTYMISVGCMTAAVILGVISCFCKQ